MEALINSRRDTDHFKHLLEILFLILLSIEIAGYLAQIDVAAQSFLQVFHRPVCALVELAQLGKFALLPSEDLLV